MEEEEKWKRRCEKCQFNPCDSIDRILKAKCSYEYCFDKKK